MNYSKPCSYRNFNVQKFCLEKTGNMDNDFLKQIEKIIQQRATTEPLIYLQNLQKLKDLLVKKSNNSIEELNKIKQKHHILKNRRHKEIPEIGHEKEWTNFYIACCEYYKNKTVPHNNNDIESFHRQISDKLEKQTRRLKKLQDYSFQLKNSYETSHITKSAHREKRYREADTILKRFNFRIQSEKQKNYDDKILSATKEAQKLLESLESINQQNMQNISAEKSLKESNHHAELEITKIEENLKLRENAVSQSWEAISNGNFELNNRINSTKHQINTLKNEIKNIDALLMVSQKTLDEITKSQQIIDKLYESVF